MSQQTTAGVNEVMLKLRALAWTRQAVTASHAKRCVNVEGGSEGVFVGVREKTC